MTRAEPLQELERQIANGWGDIPGLGIPKDWTERQGPCPVKGFDHSFASVMRVCFICGSRMICTHREPELVEDLILQRIGMRAAEKGGK